MRVLHVNAGNLHGGVETVLATIARSAALCSALEAEFALCFSGRAEDELRAAGGVVHRLGAVRIRSPLGVMRARRALRRLIALRGYDAVICHSPWSQAIFAPAARAAGAASVLWLHDLLGGRHWLERWAARAAPDGIICNSRFTAESLPRVYPRIAHEVVYCPVAPASPALRAERATVRAELAVAEPTVVVIQTSRLEQWKGHRLHLEALARLRDAPGWACWIVGGAQRPPEARYREELRAAASRMGIESRIGFLGQRGDVARLLAAADIHCQPNVGPEPFGIAFIEALYAGLPVVTTAHGGALEVVDSSCGMLVEPGNPDALAGALGRLIADRELRARLGAGGPARAAALCDPRAQMAALLAALGRLCGTTGRASREPHSSISPDKPPGTLTSRTS